MSRRLVARRSAVRAALAFATLAALPTPAIAGPAADGTATRTSLGAAPAAGAPGRTLELSTVRIPAGAALATHRHPGTQIATILSGRLSYAVVAGAVEVYRRGPSGVPVLVRTLGPGESSVLVAGSTVVEQPGDVHRSANRGDTPVRISLATLFRTGAPASTPVRAAATPTATGKLLVRRFLSLLVAKDVAGLDALLSPAFQVQRADGSASSKAAYLRRLADIQSFRVSGVVGTRAGNTLVVRYLARVTGTVEGRAYTPGPAPRLSTFVFVGGAWRLVAHANFNPLGG
jgi:quercetin dioxygenase-like cupin family protein